MKARLPSPDCDLGLTRVIQIELATPAASELHKVCFSLTRYFAACLLGSSAGLT